MDGIAQDGQCFTRFLEWHFCSAMEEIICMQDDQEIVYMHCNYHGVILRPNSLGKTNGIEENFPYDCSSHLQSYKTSMKYVE